MPEQVTFSLRVNDGKEERQIEFALASADPLMTEFVERIKRHLAGIFAALDTIQEKQAARQAAK